ncbi:response regulator transcription factor [Deinococcus sp.]|uniref:helix-turn-helix transcriptional regulator n=1 Tax=Deinococcus sp. TaxID=47478 RepID=UPI003CC57F19
MTLPPPRLRVRIDLRSALLSAGIAALLAADERLELVEREAEVLILDTAGLSDWLLILSPEAEAGVVVLSDEVPWLAELLEREAGWAWLPPEVLPAELAAAVQAAGAGLVGLLPEQARAAWNARAPDEAGTPRVEDAGGVALTPREGEVLALLGLGLSNKRVARELGVSDHTVKFHVTALYSKLNVSSRTAAVTRAIQLGLLSV